MLYLPSNYQSRRYDFRKGDRWLLSARAFGIIVDTGGINSEFSPLIHQSCGHVLELDHQPLLDQRFFNVVIHGLLGRNHEPCWDFVL